MARNKMMTLTLTLLCMDILLTNVVYASGDCPSYTMQTTCTPKCVQDSDCSSIGGKCCPNICNQRSCVQSNRLGNSGSSSPFDKKSGGSSGSYCGNVKCSPFEKCESDRSTKRPKCVRM